MKRFLKLFLIIALLFGMERLCHHATDGFALVNVYAPVGNNDRWKTTEPLPEGLCDKPFHYLNSGSQSYVFVSEDGKTVLKLFKFQHMRTPPILNFLPSKGKLGKKRVKKRKVLENTLDSLTLAYTHLKEETGLLYLHLAKTNHLHKKITFTDKIGRTYTLDLDGIEFLLQKRGTLAYDAINEWMANGAKTEAERGIQALLKLVKERCQKGIFDKDPDFKTNFGFIEETPFQMDFGRLSLSEEEKDPHVYGPEMIRITRPFETWIAENHPDLLDSFKKELHEIVSL
jgi:hypothetical protein